MGIALRGAEDVVATPQSCEELARGECLTVREAALGVVAKVEGGGQLCS